MAGKDEEYVDIPEDFIDRLIEYLEGLAENKEARELLTELKSD